MNQTELQMLVQLKDEVSSGFQQIEKNIAGSTSKMNTSTGGFSAKMVALGSIMADVAEKAGAEMYDFLKSTIKAGAEAQRALANMTATLVSMGPEAVRNKQAILDAADATMKFGFDNNDAALSITKFYQRTKDMTQAMNLNNVAMDLARAKNMSLSDAANLVNLVLSGQGRMLAQYGIKLKDAATPLEALGELQKQVAGQAQAFSGTFEGQMQVLNSNFNQIKETIGIALIEALTPFINKLTVWLTDPATKDNIMFVVNAFIKFATVVGTLLVNSWKGWVDILTNAWTILFKIYDVLSNIVIKAAQVGQSLGGNVIDAWKNAGANIQFGVSKLMGRASGGPVYAGTPYMVGENGPEMFVPGKSGTIVPNTSGGGGGGVMVSISGNFYGSDETMAQKMGDMIAKIIGQQTKLRVI